MKNTDTPSTLGPRNAAECMVSRSLSLLRVHAFAAARAAPCLVFFIFFLPVFINIEFHAALDLAGRVVQAPVAGEVAARHIGDDVVDVLVIAVEAVHSVLERTPPELTADIADRGIVLTGGGALLRGLEEMIEERTGINTMTADDPTQVVAIGTGQFVELTSMYKE